MRFRVNVAICAFVVAGAETFPTFAQEWVMACGESARPCAIDGTRMVQFGANGRFYFGVATNRLICSPETFGDPAPGIPKSCWYLETAREHSLATQVADQQREIEQLKAHADSLERETRDLKAELKNVTSQLEQRQRDLWFPKRPPPPPDRPRSRKN